VGKRASVFALAKGPKSVRLEDMSLSRAVPTSVSGTVGAAEMALPEDSDAALVARVQAGDVAAFDGLVRKYRERLFAILYNLTSNREDAADLTQEAFIKAFRSIGKFKGDSAFFTWLYRIGVNAGLSQMKRHRWRRFFSLEQLDESAPAAEIVELLTGKERTDRSALLAELQEKLNEALQKLSPQHRTVVVLFEIEGLDHRAIAEIMECSEGTVRSRLHYAKQQLQGFLQDYLK